MYKNHFVEVILPIALNRSFTYLAPEEMMTDLAIGKRVEVPFGKSKLYAGIVKAIHEEQPKGYKVKPILSVIDEIPVVTKIQLELWDWMAKYYCCTVGEVMSAALPAVMKMQSETKIVLSPLFDGNMAHLSDEEYLIAEALSMQEELSVQEVQKILQKKSVSKLLKRLFEKKVIFLSEEMKERYKPKMIGCIRFAEPYRSDSSLFEKAFELCKRSKKQTDAILVLYQLAKKEEFVLRQSIYDKADATSAVLKALEKKGIVELYERNKSRIETGEADENLVTKLSPAQREALEQIENNFKEKDAVLLHGITGSGKTQIYIELIKKVLEEGGQVLYLLPEIALTAQIVNRLNAVFGNEVVVYHSRQNGQERGEVWLATLAGKSIIIGARSAILMPFSNLKLIIVDEEHDASYKQSDPSPRYHGRDLSIVLAKKVGAKVLLGTATPAIETYYNAQKGKYGLVELLERFGAASLPEVRLVSLNDSTSGVQSHFSDKLLEELKAAKDKENQSILFQNRRGYAPVLRCGTCGWTQECVHCDVSLTYHKYNNTMRCHYCGFHAPLPNTCPACENKLLTLKGFGTEKIEDELKIYLPSSRVGRMDWDTVKGKNAYAKLINDFEERRLDVLVGTQMVTKGLDFDNVKVVGVLNADTLLYFPDFRASERAFQLLTQVSGRAGRKGEGGLVLIQTFNPSHPVLKDVITGDFKTFYKREIKERGEFKYPPFSRLIKVTLKHKKPEKVKEAANIFRKEMKAKLGNRLIGPAVSGIPRIRNHYIMDALIKLETDMRLITATKQWLLDITDDLKARQGLSQLRVVVDVDTV